VVFLVILAGFTLVSAVRGALKEALSLLGLAAGYWAGLRFHEEAGAAIAPIVQDQHLAELLAFLLLLAAGYLLGTFLGGATDNMASRSRGAFTVLMSGLIGMAKGLIVCLTLFWLVEAYIPPFQGELGASGSAPYLNWLLDWVQRMTL
jgi:uncharacterized membrane protein required for colicin V production